MIRKTPLRAIGFRGFAGWARRFSEIDKQLAECLTDETHGWPHGLTSTETVGLP